MLEKRNPLKKIGKVMKYELKHSYRILLPMYGVLLFVGLLIGMFGFPADIAKVITSDDGFSMHYKFESQDAVVGSIVFLSFVLAVSIVVVTIVALNRRFKKSMLEEEAYLNLSLPVTIGEHLWGRFLADVIWMFCSGAVIVCSFLLCFVRVLSAINLSDKEWFIEITRSGLTVGWMIFDAIAMYLLEIMLFVTFCFLLHSFGSLFKKNNGLAKFITAIVMIYLYTRVSSLFPHHEPDFSNLSSVTANFQLTLFKLMILNAIFIAVNFIATHIIFTKKMNLE